MKKFKGRRGMATALSAMMMMNGLGAVTPLIAAPLSTEAVNEIIQKYSFGEVAQSGYTQVTSGQVYNQALGYGFSTEVYGTAAPGWINGVYYPRVVNKTVSDAQHVQDVTGGVQVGSKVWTETESTGYGVYTYENTSTFDIDLVSQDYKVTVELFNPTEEAISVYLEAEDITKVRGVEIQPGETVRKTFTACLVDGQLNLKFLASSNATTDAAALEKGVYVSKVELESVTRTQGDKPTLFIASDSTVQTYEKNYYPQTGWGQVLHNFFKGGDQVEERECENCDYSQAQTYETEAVVIENRAIGGRSSKSFIEEGKIDDLLEDVKPGDFVLVQWGHNDATASRPNRYVSPDDFEKYIQYYIDGVSQRGGTCILVTPVARRSYNTSADGTVSFNSNFEAYRKVMLKMGSEQQVPVLDLTQASIDVCNKFGEEGSKSLFLWLNAGDYPDSAYAGGVSDSTHLQYYGAYKFAQCVAELIKDYDQDGQLEGLKTLVDIPAQFTEEPARPTGLQTTTIGASSISMKWDSQEDAELYYIYRAELLEGQSAEDVVFNKDNKYSVSATPKYTDGNCEGGKTYVYAIAGFNEIGVGDFSDSITVTTKSAAYKYDFSQLASNPTMQGWTGVHSTQSYTQAAGYGWKAAPGNGRYRANNGNADSNDMTDDFCLGNGEFVIDLPNGEYEVKVTACDLLPGTSTIKPSYTAEGLSIGGISTKQAAGTLSATVKVMDGQLNIGVGGTNPYINGLEITPIRLSPTGFIYQELSFNGDQANFLLNWDDVSGAVAYKVYRKTSSDTSFTVHKTITQTEKDDAITMPFAADLGEVVQYYVTAVFEDGTETPPSTMIEIEMLDKDGVKPIAPTGVVAVAATNEVEVKWNGIEGAIKYLIYRSDREEGSKGYKGYQKIAEVKGTSYTDTAITTNTKWYYKVVAVNAAGPGEMSQSASSSVTTTLDRTAAEVLTDRALVAINLSGDLGVGSNVDGQGKEGTNVSVANEGVYLSWRLFERDPSGTTFTLYKNGEVIASALELTNYLDSEGTSSDVYKVVGSSDSQLGLTAQSVATWQNHYIEFQLDKPADQQMPDGTTCTYTANDMSVADLDGDGQYELIVKWYPSNAQDNSKSGYTGTTILDAYDIDINTGEASRMWRIDLGVNIRSGAHYTQFQAWDLDGDGIAEIACKTADGTVDGKGNVIGDASADYRNSGGYVLDGPEYFTVFDGKTGAVIDTVDYIPERGSVSAWGDAYGNRVDRFLSCVAYLDGQMPSVVMGRGYYTRTCLTAYSLVDGKIETTWIFDTDETGKEYEAQGNHSIAVADIDGDGKDEIIYGALVIDHDGTVKYSTGLGHGDAMHISDWMAHNDGLEIMSVHEHSDAEYQVEIRDAETGEILTGFFTGKDTGRGMAADIDPTYSGAEFWSSIEWDGTMGGLYSSTSTMTDFVQISERTPSVNFSLYWDGDLLAELQDHTFNNKNGNYHPVSTNITKWDYENKESVTLFESSDIFTSNGTKGNVGLVADVLGDWREEIIARTSEEGNDKIRIYSTTIETDYALPTFMDDNEYRLGVAWQNVGYNQPTHTSYLISEGVQTAEVQIKESNKDGITLTWSEASDGAYGHEVEGYYIYRYDEETGAYVEIGRTESAEGRSFVDTEIVPNSTYRYAVAAMLKGRESYRSQAVETTTQLDIASVLPLENVELVQGDVNYKSYLPEVVTVVDAAGNEVEGIAITWDTASFDITQLGEGTLNGKIKGYEPVVPLTVTVVPNTVVGFEDLVDIMTIVNVAPELPTSLVHQMKDGTTKVAEVVWNIEGLDIATVGSYTIMGQSELADEIVLKVEVKANYIVSIEALDAVEVSQGEQASLPSEITVTYADQTTGKVPVEWESVDTSVVGTIQVQGKVEGLNEPVWITVYVTVQPLYRFDFGINAQNEANGWTGITVNAKGGTNTSLGAYSEALGYGFAEIGSTVLSSALEGRHENYIYEGVLPSNAYVDFVLPAGRQFIVDVPNGSYTVQVVSGSYYKSNVKGEVEGNAFNVGNAAQTYEIMTLEEVIVEDGQMNFIFDAGTTSRMNAIMIIENEVAPEPEPEVVIVSIQEVEAIEMNEGCEDFEAYFPAMVTATNSLDEIVEVAITWDLSTFDVHQVGEVIVYGTVEGYDALVPVHVTIQAVEGPEDPDVKPLPDDAVAVTPEVSYASDWGSGSTGEIILTNTTEVDFYDGWTFEFDCDREITSMWGADLISKEGTHYVVTSPSWSKTLLVGQSVNIGFMTGEAVGDGEIKNAYFSNVVPREEVEDESTAEYTFEYQSDWGTGASAKLVLTNNTGVDFEYGWRVAFDFKRDIVGLWDAHLEQVGEGQYQVSNATWSPILKAGESAVLYFNAGTGSILDKITNVHWQ